MIHNMLIPFFQPDNFFYFLILFLISVFSGTYLLYAYYRDKLLALNTLIFFLCAYRIAFEYYVQTIGTYEELIHFVELNGYGIPINVLIGGQWLCMWYYVRPFKNFKLEKILNILFTYVMVVIPFLCHSIFMAKGLIFEYHPNQIDGYWKFTMNTDHWYFPFYFVHTRAILAIVIIILIIGAVQTKRRRFRQVLLLISYIVIPFLYLKINVPSTWNIPNSGLLHILHTIVLSWYLSNYRLFKSNIQLISDDLFNSISDLTISTDKQLNIISCNDQTRSYFGVSAQHIRSFFNKYAASQNQDFQSTIDDLVANSEHTIEVIMLDISKRRVIFNVKVAPFINGDKLYGYTFLMTDLTALKNQENRLRDLNTLKDTLFQIIGHDLKKPTIGFRNISKNINYLLEKKDYGRLKALGEDVDRDAKSLYTLTDNLLNWALVQKDSLNIRPENVKVYNLVEGNFQLFRSIAEQKEICLINQVDSTHTAYIDRDSLDTIIRNLIDNALKFTEKNGRIVLNSSIKSEMVHIAVQDDGIGMNTELIEAILKDEYMSSTSGTSGEKGSGIGLHLVKQLLDKNNSSLYIENAAKQGSIFSITMPRAS